MLRKTLIAVAGVAALGVSSVAMAAGGHGGHGGHGAAISSGGGAAISSGGGVGSMPSGVVGSPGRDRGTVSSFNAQGPIGPKGPTTMSPKTWQGNTSAWNHHHHRFHNRVFFGVGFAGPYDYDYGYDSCWRIVPTAWGGWRRVWVCDYPYPYWGY